MKKLTSLSSFSSHKISHESSKLVIGGITAPSIASATSSTSSFAGCSSDEKTVTVTTCDNGSSTSVVSTQACC